MHSATEADRGGRASFDSRRETTLPRNATAGYDPRTTHPHSGQECLQRKSPSVKIFLFYTETELHKLNCSSLAFPFSESYFTWLKTASPMLANIIFEKFLDGTVEILSYLDALKLKF